MNKYDYVVMDMDGTLVDTDDTHNKIFEYYFSRNYTDFPIMEVLNQEKGGSMLAICRRSGMSDEKIVEMLENLTQFYLTAECKALYSHLNFAEGAKDVINTLIDNGVPVALISNSLYTLVENIMKNNGMYNVFDTVVGATAHTQSKSENFKRLINNKKLNPAKVLYLGDYEGDIKVSRECGIDCCILYSPISWTRSLDDLLSDPGPDYVIKHIEKFLNIAL